MRQCRECGSPIAPPAAPGPARGRYPRDIQFCPGRWCKGEYHARRQRRGLAIVDLAMAWRCDRGLARKLGVLKALCRLIEKFRDEDMRLRAGRKSWDDPNKVLERDPWLRSIRGKLV